MHFTRVLLRTRRIGMVALLSLVIGAAWVLFAPPAATQEVQAAGFVALEPARVLDSRAEFQVGDFGSAWGAGETRTVQVGGRGGVPVSGVEAVVLNVTTVGPSAGFSWLTMFPAGGVRPDAAAVNFGSASFTSEITNDAVVVKVDALGRVDVFNQAGSVDVVMDVAGYFEAEPSSMSGSVTDIGGDPLAGIEACVQPLSTALSSSCATTDAEGAYTIEILTTGDYQVMFDDPAQVYLAEYYDNTFSSFNATVFRVISGAIFEEIDASLAEAGQISGSVQSGAGDPLAGIEVCALGQGDFYVACITTGADGLYELKQLRSGDYRVRARDTANEVFVTEYFDDALQLFDATLFDIEFGDALTDINFVLTQGASVSGTVTNTSGQHLAGIEVCLTFNRCAFTTQDGAYRFDRVAPGDYLVRFLQTNEYFFEYYDGVTSSADATIVTVARDQQVVGIDASMEPKPAIHGTVVDMSGNPISGYEVCVRSSSNFQFCRTTNDMGVYSFTGLQPGDYRVEFNDGTGTGYVDEYHDNVMSFADATPVNFDGVTTVTIDAELADGAAVTGSILSDVDGQPVIDAVACASEVDGLGLGCAEADADGNFRLSGLADGDYRFFFFGVGHTEEYWDDAIGIIGSTQISLSAGGTVPNLDVALAPEATVSGTVRDTNGAPLQGIAVGLWDANGSTRYEYTAADGTFLFSGLTAGSYTVSFEDFNGGYVTQYWDGVASAANATTVDLVAGQKATGVDAALQPM